MRRGPELFKIRTPHRISADLNILRTAHTGFADLNTMIFGGSTSLAPPENGAGEFSGPKKCQYLPKKMGSRVVQVEQNQIVRTELKKNEKM